MKKLFIALTALTLFASCKKEDVTQSLAPSTGAAKNMLKATYVWDNGTPEIDEYTYDAQRNVTVIKGDDRTVTFNYVSATAMIATEKNNADNSLYRTYECTLNDKGAVTKMIMKNAAGALYYTYDFTYNTDGYLTNQKGSYAGGGTDYEQDYTIINGNAVSMRSYNNTGLSYTGEYTYDNGKLNKTPGGHGGYWQSYTLFGMRTKNLLKEYKSFNPSNTLTFHAQYTYDMDADGYPVKQTTKDILRNEEGVDTFIYQ